MKKFSVILLMSLILLSCAGDVKETTQDGDFKIGLLFELDGCKVYRFKDAGRYVYWSNCQGSIKSTYYQSTGKSGHTVETQSFTTE